MLWRLPMCGQVLMHMCACEVQSTISGVALSLAWSSPISLSWLVSSCLHLPSTEIAIVAFYVGLGYSVQVRLCTRQELLWTERSFSAPKTTHLWNKILSGNNLSPAPPGRIRLNRHLKCNCLLLYFIVAAGKQMPGLLSHYLKLVYKIAGLLTFYTHPALAGPTPLPSSLLLPISLPHALQPSVIPFPLTHHPGTLILGSLLFQPFSCFSRASFCSSCLHPHLLPSECTGVARS